MKRILIVIAIALSSTIQAQSVDLTGTYDVHYETNDGVVIDYNLSLNPNGTFLFHFYRKLADPNPEESYFGQGRWRSDKKLIFFEVNAKNEVNEDHTLNLNNSKARFNPKNGILLFYSSKISWVKGIKLNKKDI